MADDKKAFDRDLNATPPLTWRIVIGIVGSPSANMTMQQLIEFVTQNTDTYTKEEIDAFFENYLAKNNLLEYIPSQDFHPATKKSSEDISKASYVSITSFGGTTSDGVGKVSQADNVVHFSGKFEDANMQDGDTAFTLPASIEAPLIDIYISFSNVSGGGGARAKIAAGQKAAVIEDQESGTGVVLSFNEVYLISN